MFNRLISRIKKNGKAKDMKEAKTKVLEVWKPDMVLLPSRTGRPESPGPGSSVRDKLFFNLARRVSLLLCALGVLVFLCGESSLAGDQMSELREKAKNRQRRVIYNNDGGDIGGHFSSVEEFLSQRTEVAIGTQVDSIFYATIWGSALCTHDTNVGERMDGLVDAIQSTVPTAVNVRDNMRMLRKAGTDSLKATITRTHEAGLELFWSYRINDSHDSVLEWDHLLSQWKRQHPEYLMGVPEDTKKYPQSSPKYWWSTFDFEKPQVRDYLFRVTEDVCQRYDVDGIEIDYWRYPLFFRPNLDGKPVTKEQLDILTEFQRKIRQMAEREGEKRGRPILVAARVPMAVANCRNVGIDIERWLREGLLDIMVLGNGDAWLNLPAEELVKLGHKYKVLVYPCLKWSGYGHKDIETWRAASSNAWRIGADGIYFFNIGMFADTFRRRCFTQLGDPKKLARLDKLFAATDLTPHAHIMLMDPEQRHCGLANVLPWSMALPAKLSPGGESYIVRLQIGDDIATASERGRLACTVLKIRLSPPKSLDAVEVRLNGKLLTPTAKDAEKGWRTFSPEPAWYRVGDNEVSFRLAKTSGDRHIPVQVLAVEVGAHYGK